MIYVKSIINNLLQEIVGKIDEKCKIIKINSNNLCNSGDLSFPINLLAWKSFIEHYTDYKNKNILEYYLKRRNIDITNYSNEVVQQEAFHLLISTSKQWILSIGRVSLQNEKVCVFLNRSCVSSAVIKFVIKNNKTYGQQSTTGKKIYLTINEDIESNLTTARLHQLKNICENILTLHGYIIKEDDAHHKYCLTTKSQGKLNDESYEKYVCGVVKNSDTNSKETSLTYEMYVQKKIKELAKMNEGRALNSSDEHEWLQTIAEAALTFEFCSVKPSQSTFVQSVNNSAEGVTNNKGGAFVLYNAARIIAILNKFKDEQLCGNYPELWNVDKVNFENLVLEDEWCLVYSFILGYPEMVMNSLLQNTKHEFYTHTICSFLSHLSQRFSIYYRRCRILTQGRDHLLPTMMARLYLLKALQIVYINALAILNIKPISRM